jgi:hypothetical protein
LASLAAEPHLAESNTVLPQPPSCQNRQCRRQAGHEFTALGNPFLDWSHQQGSADQSSSTSCDALKLAYVAFYASLLNSTDLASLALSARQPRLQGITAGGLSPNNSRQQIKTTT